MQSLFICFSGICHETTSKTFPSRFSKTRQLLKICKSITLTRFSLFLITLSGKKKNHTHTHTHTQQQCYRIVLQKRSYLINDSIVIHAQFQSEQDNQLNHLNQHHVLPASSPVPCDHLLWGYLSYRSRKAGSFHSNPSSPTDRRFSLVRLQQVIPIEPCESLWRRQMLFLKAFDAQNSIMLMRFH